MEGLVQHIIVGVEYNEYLNLDGKQDGNFRSQTHHIGPPVVPMRPQMRGVRLAHCSKKSVPFGSYTKITPLMRRPQLQQSVAANARTLTLGLCFA